MADCHRVVACAEVVGERDRRASDNTFKAHEPYTLTPFTGHVLRHFNEVLPSADGLIRKCEAVRPLWSVKSEASSLSSSRSVGIKWGRTMKSPCPECAASSVWISVAKVARECATLVMQWRCTLWSA
jgi:hypothetical protein